MSNLFHVNPRIAFLAELAKTTPVVLNNKEQYLQRLAAVWGSCRCGYADLAIPCPAIDRYLNPWDGAEMTRTKLKKSEAFLGDGSGADMEFNSKNFYEPYNLLNDATIIDIKRNEHLQHSAVMNELLALTDEEWIDMFGFYITDLETVYAKKCTDITIDNFNRLPRRERHALMFIFDGVHWGLRYVPEKYYSFSNVFELVCRNTLDNKDHVPSGIWQTEIY